MHDENGIGTDGHQMAAPRRPPAVAWNECPCVFSGRLESLEEGPTQTMLPIYSHTLTFTVTELLRGQLPEGVAVGAALRCSHRAVSGKSQASQRRVPRASWALARCRMAARRWPVRRFGLTLTLSRRP